MKRAAVEAPKWTEEALLNAILHLAGFLGWKTAHFRPARTAQGWRTPVQGDGNGFPDLVMLRGSRLVVAELKADRGRLSPEQADWIARWRMIGCAEVFVWRPDDLEEIARILT